MSKKLPQTFNQQFKEVVQRNPDRTAFRMKTSEGYTTVSYREASHRSVGVAIGLLASGLQHGSRVAILSENRPEWVVAYLGVYLSGTVAVPLDTQITPAEWRRLIDDSEAKVIFVSGALRRKLLDAVAGSASSPMVISFDPAPDTGDVRGELAGFIDWAYGISDPPALPEVVPSDTATIIYTSGTTGVPKGVLLTHYNIVKELQCVFGAIHADENDTLLCLLPLQHVLASVINVLVPLYKGGQVVFADTLKRSEILQALAEAGITILATVPQFFYLFHNRIREELSKKPPVVRKVFRGMLRLNRFSMRFLKINLGSRLFAKVHHSFGARLRLFISGGSSFEQKVAQDFHDMGFTIIQGYGLTETTGACTVTRLENNVIGSVGPPLPEVEIKIDSPDEAGIGEILIRGPMVMKEYYRNPDATNEVLKDGWFHSGDLGRLDDRGNLFITGRRKEVIVLPNGKNIYPDELETHYLQSPFIQEIAVIGISNRQEPGERLHGVVVPNFDFLKSKKIANARETIRDEIASLSNRLPKYKRLMSYQIQADPLMRTTTRKIKRLELKKLVESGHLTSSETNVATAEPGPEDKALLESAIGQEVLHCLRENYRRDTPVTPNMNLELDLGFDSMERVEFIADLEQRLNLKLPEDFGAEIFTLRDLILRLEQEAGVAPRAGAAVRQSWKKILEAEPQEQEKQFPYVSGTAMSLAKYACSRAIYYLFFRTLLRMETRGLENLPLKGPYLVCPNHQSYLDPLVLASVLPFSVFRRMFFVGYSLFFTSRIMKLVARLTNIVPVDPDAHLLHAMKAGAAGLRDGYILCIFPEGGRSFDGTLQPFKKGAAILSRELSAPVIPTAIGGTYEVWPRDSIRIRPHKVTITFGKPIMPEETGDADPYRSDTDRLWNAIAGLMQKQDKD